MADIFSKLKSKYKKVNYSCEVCSSKKFDNIINYGRIAEPGQYGKLVIKSCKICGYKHLCPNCSIYLTFHNLKNKAICHHCGYEKDIQRNCKDDKKCNFLKFFAKFKICSEICKIQQILEI